MDKGAKVTEKVMHAAESLKLTTFINNHLKDLKAAEEVMAVKKREEKAENLNRLGLKCEVFLARVAEYHHKESGHNLRKGSIPS